MGTQSLLSAQRISRGSASPDGTNYYVVYEWDDSDASALPMTVAAGRTYQLPTALWGLRYLKIVAGTEQTGAITLYVDVL